MNPALTTLFRFHARGTVRRVKRQFASPRRLVLSLVALALGGIWLGQIIVAAMLRDAWDRTVFHSWVSLIVMLYFAWHVIRVAWQRPETAIEWNPAESEFLVGGPLTRNELLAYRLGTIFTATLPKALITGVALWPDLWWVGFPGIVLALVFLECVRLAMDTGVSCLSARGYSAFRSIVFVSLFLAVAVAVRGAAVTDEFHGLNGVVDGLSLLSGTVIEMNGWRATTAGRLVEFPFAAFAGVIGARGFTMELALNAVTVLVLFAGVAAAVVMFDRIYHRLEIRPIGSGTVAAMARTKTSIAQTAPTTLPRVPYWFGAGPLAWRQSKSAWRYVGSVVIALGIPGILACLPLAIVGESTAKFLSVFCGVLFYSFVLLPEAVKFDFRLDTDHLAKLKVLPITPSLIVLGQMAVPVVLGSAFQISVLIVAGIVSAVSPVLVAGSVLLLVPITSFFVGLDNLIFLLYPHRPTQEGLEAFLRTILKFTFKSLLLLLAAGVTIAWAPLARLLCAALQAPRATPAIFMLGLSVLATVAAAATFALVVRSFKRFDVAMDAAV